MSLVTAPMDKPICLFLVGLQCRSWKSLWKVPLIARRMGQMQKELRADPESGLIWGGNFTAQAPFTTLFLSYWKSADHVHRFVSDEKFSHKSSASNYWKRFGKDPNLGVWHETYEIDPSRTENLYFGMAPFGASAFLNTVPVTEQNRTFLSRLRGQSIAAK